MFGMQVLADMIISNESRIAKSYVVTNFKKPRQYVASISIRHKDMGLVEPITAGMKKCLEDCTDIEHNLPYFVGLTSLDNHACNLSILVGLELIIVAQMYSMHSYAEKRETRGVESQYV